MLSSRSFLSITQDEFLIDWNYSPSGCVCTRASDSYFADTWSERAYSRDNNPDSVLCPDISFETICYPHPIISLCFLFCSENLSKFSTAVYWITALLGCKTFEKSQSKACICTPKQWSEVELWALTWNTADTYNIFVPHTEVLQYLFTWQKVQ